MQVRLKVIGGKNDGREINISVPQFIIGRGEDAHLRPSSDLVSRQHCAIKVGDGQVTVEDMGSRNGTFLNGKQLETQHKVQPGDTLRVGRLQFEIVVDHAKPGNKKPKIGSVVEAAAQRAKAKPSSIEDSISDWLSEEVADSRADYKTVQFNLEETQSNSDKDESTKSEVQTHDSVSSGELETVETDTKEKKKKKKKKEKGKLPPVPKFSHNDSTVAADDVLRKFFNRR